MLRSLRIVVKAKRKGDIKLNATVHCTDNKPAQHTY